MKNKKIVSEQTREKIRNKLKGRIIPELQKKQISQTLMEHFVSKETRDKISINQKGKIRKPLKYCIDCQKTLNSRRNDRCKHCHNIYALQQRYKNHTKKIKINSGKHVYIKNIITPELLNLLYIDNKLSSTEISKLLKISVSTIFKKLKLFNIKIRSASESKTGSLNPSFGKKQSYETKLKRKIYEPTILSRETIEKIRQKNIGRKFSIESKERLRQSHLKYYQNHPEAKEIIKQRRAKMILPLKDTSIEVKIQEYLKQLGINFFTHQYLNQIQHSYQCDILIPSLNMVIECDGNYWHNYPIGKEIDHIRTKEILEKGFKILRLWESEIKSMSLNDFEKKLKTH